MITSASNKSIKNVQALLSKAKERKKQGVFVVEGPKIIRVEAMHRVADIYGPLPYSQAMKGGSSVPYDDLKTLYETFIQELNESVDALTTFVDEGKASSERLQKFDIVCGSDHKQWIRFANTLRLRLAMRISMVEPELAKRTAEAAVNHKYGVLVAGNILKRSKVDGLISM